jgi:Ca-activated chloride channel homolog
MMPPRDMAAIAGWLLPLVLLAAMGLYILRRRRVARALGEPAMVTRLLGTDLRRVPVLTVLTVLLAGVGVATALLLAARDFEDEPATGGGGSLVLVLDASNSMLAADLVPNRLEVQREAARRIVRAGSLAQVGIVVFAGRGYTLTPPTHDHNSVMVFLDAIDPGMVTQEGSSIEAAVRQGAGLLVAGGGEETGGTMVLITDGDDSDPRETMDATLDLIARAGIVVHTLGAATPDGAPVPLPGDTSGYMTTRDGAPIVSRLDERGLRDIAAATGGVYAPLDDPSRVNEVIAALPSGVTTVGAGREGIPPYAWPATGALLLLALQAGLARRRWWS